MNPELGLVRGAGGMDELNEWVGRRVALRHRVGERDGRPLYSDAVGELADDGPDAVLVHTRRGSVQVARAAVFAVRMVPPAPPRRASWAAVARLEGLCADAWPALVDQPLGAWRLRAAGGFTGRANAGLAIGDPGGPIGKALDAVQAFAAEHGVPPRVQVPIGSPWDRAVAGQGWVLDVGHAAGAESAVLVADLASLASRSSNPGPGRSGAPLVELLTRPDRRWWELSLGREPVPVEQHVLAPDAGPRTVFGLIPDVGVLRGAVVDDHLQLSRLAVRPAARRAGFATALTTAVAQWGRAQGARWAVLQVALHNVVAREFYQRLGCVEHHRYRYLVPPTWPTSEADAGPGHADDLGCAARGQAAEYLRGRVGD